MSNNGKPLTLDKDTTPKLIVAITVPLCNDNPLMMIPLSPEIHDAVLSYLHDLRRSNTPPPSSVQIPMFTAMSVLIGESLAYKERKRSKGLVG